MLTAGRNDDDASRDALGRLCELYWYPVYAFIRRQGHSADDAMDLTQEFFARVVEKSYFRTADPARGRFRSFLLGCLRHFLSNERDREATLKRGGAHVIVSLEIETGEERYSLEPRDELSPDKIFDRRWALDLVDRALNRLRDEHAARGKQEAFDALKCFLTGDSAGTSYREIAERLGTTEGTAKVAVHRLRRRFKDLLTDEVAQTVADPREVDDEIRYLLSALSPP